MQPKIATCCYCGTRAALVLDKARHELACSACGAPLHNLKGLKSDHIDKRKASHQPKYGAPLNRQKQNKKKKKKKSGMSRFFGEAFDIIEDIFD